MFEIRAQQLHGSKWKDPKNEIARNLSAGEYWKQYVNDKESAEKFYKMYYPEFPQCLVTALVNRIDGAVKGENGIDETWIRKKGEMSPAEELMKEIEE